jgi:hypothetical protein
LSNQPKDDKTAGVRPAPGQTHHRDHSLDFLRGSAVFLMIVTHVNAFFYGETGTWLDAVTWWGATVCFTVFLFVSGAISGMTIKKGTMTRFRAFMRGFSLLGVYYILAFLMAFFNENFSSTIGTTINILTFRIIPEFTEFLLPFVFFPMLVAIALPVLKKIKHNSLLLISISIIAFAVASVLYKLDWGGGYMVVIKSLLVGEGDLHRFPLVSYLPVYTVGMWWGLRNREDKKHELFLTKNILLLSISLFLMLLLTGVSTWNRWPPSLLFFSYGFIFIFSVILLHNQLHLHKWAHDAVAFLGHYSTSYLMYHLVAILLLKTFVVTGPLDEISTIFMIFLTFLISSSFLILSDVKKFLYINLSRLYS